jgi:hypothetical protein
MPAAKKGKSNKVYISLGKITKKFKDDEGKDRQRTDEEFLVINENLAKLTGAAYVTTPPKPKIVTTKKGKTYEVEQSVSQIRTKFKVGYVAGTDKVKKKAIIKWVGIPIPAGVTTKQMLEVLRTKFPKKPVYFKSGDGITQRFISAK